MSRAKPLSDREKAFAAALLTAASLEDAYESAGYRRHRGNALRLAKDSRVRAELERLSPTLPAILPAAAAPKPAAKRGRPAFEPTPSMSRRVEEYAAAGMREEAIAAAIGCSPPTLRLRFRDALKRGPARMHAAAIRLLWASARKGNVAAQKRLEEMTRVAQATVAFEGEDDAAPARRVKQLGKKEIAAAAADDAATDPDSGWGDDLLTPTSPLN